MQLMLKYTIRTILFLLTFFSFSQEKDSINQEKVNDSLPAQVYKQKYGLRVGIDLSKPIRTYFNDDYKGFEIVGDFRISQKLYIAAELGTEEKTSQEDLYNFTTTGSYLKAGLDINTYENWYGMENLITLGFRAASSTFKQQVNEYKIYNTNPFWGEGVLLGTNPDILGEKEGLSAVWLELILGLKAEIFNNLYIGGSVRLNYLISNKEADNFRNLYIPGFNKVTDGSKFGVGYNYTISYLIPIFQKNKKPKKEKEEIIEEESIEEN